MPVVVFVTAFDRYALRAFEVSACDYLLKPFDERGSNGPFGAPSTVSIGRTKRHRNHCAPCFEP